MTEKEKEIRQFLHESGVPLALDPNRSIISSIRWLVQVWKYSEKREKTISDKFGLKALHDKSGKVFIVPTEKTIEEQKSKILNALSDIWQSDRE